LGKKARKDRPRKKSKALGVALSLREKAGAKPAKSRRHKMLKGSNEDSSARQSPSAKLARVTRERDAVLEQQTATADILKLISQTTLDLRAVLEAVVRSAVQLCDADTGVIRRRDGDRYPLAATFGLTDEERDHFARYSAKPDRGSVFGRAILELRPIHVPDLLADRHLDQGRLQDYASAINIRSGLGVPLLREGTAIGVFTLQRRRKRPFTRRQIELVETFANQAVIAIENARLIKETKEALGRQTATADVLRVIATSPTDLQPVFNAIAERSNELIGGYSTAVYRFVGRIMHLAAFTRVSPEADAALEAYFPRPLTGVPHFERVSRGETVAYSDVFAADVPKTARDVGRARGFRSCVFVPLVGDSAPIGIISVTRKDAGPFAPHDIGLLKTFASQAVIAIQNVGLFDEVKAKTRELTESLTYQTGSANILSVIASSPTDVMPVLKAIVESACEVCDAYDAVSFLKDGDHLRFCAHYGPIPFTLEKWPINRRWVAGRAFLDQKPVHVHDAQSMETDEFADAREMSHRMGHRTTLSVPLLRDGESIGAIALRRKEVNPFSERQIAALQTFADQAVIAIANTRLFEEVQAKTRDLEESLQQQTATADVLKVISRSTFDLQTVLNTLTESASQLCEADRGVIFLREGARFCLTSNYGYSAEFEAHARAHPLPADGTSTTARAAAAGTPFQALFGPDDPMSEYRRLGGFRANLGVPLRQRGEVIGVFTLTRMEPIPFTDRQIELVGTFADQAVIAIENTRLLTATREALEQQTATADILKVIASSPSDVQPVFQAIAERSNRLVNGLSTTVLMIAGDKLELVAFTPTNPQADAALLASFPRRMPDMVFGKTVMSGNVYSLPDTEDEPTLRDLARLRGYRSMLFVPLLMDGVAIGAIGQTRPEAGGFAEQHVQLLKTFADQAVIAISNVQLFQEVQQRTRELSKSLDDLRSAQDRLIQTEKLASLGQLTAGIAHEIKNPLNFVNNFASLSAELVCELDETLAPAPLDQEMRSDIGDLTQTLKSNLEKIVQHGKRADSIVKNMLLHSREGSGEQRVVDINATVDESLNLAYHGARAEKPGFNITLQRKFDQTAGSADIYPQEIIRVLLNIISNGFYAATRRAIESANGFEPTLLAETRNLGDSVEIRIRDNGIGMPGDVKAKIFTPFFTTKPPGEGTGLGLSMSHDIVVKQHGGRIDVESEPDSFTEFIITLPRHAIDKKKTGSHR
jgi:two-component system NtrC family sensor kinase